MQRLWLIAVDGPIRGETHCLEPGQEVFLGPGHWDIGPTEPVGPFVFDGRGLIAPPARRGLRNLFTPREDEMLRPGDVLEIEGQMLLISDTPPGWPGTELSDDEDGDEEAALDEQPIPPVRMPSIFWSVYHDGPFPTCLVCECELLTSGVQYGIEKIFRGNNVILELAVCVSCAAGFNGDVSEESAELIAQFGRDLRSSRPTLQQCRMCAAPRSSLTGFHIITVGFFDRSLPKSWALLCEDCLTGIDEGLSRKTRDVYRDFVDDNFPGVPAGSDMPKPVFL